MPNAAAPPLVDAEVLADLRARVRAYRRVPVAGPGDWSLGADRAYLDDLLHSWSEDYDWREGEAAMRALPWVIAGRDDAPVRAVHQRSEDPDAVAVVLLHGWPDSVLRFAKVLPRLTDVHVVVPALPGYPFASPTSRTIASARDIAVVVGEAMATLGYDRYVVAGGDVGSDVAEHLAALYPDRVAGLHLTDLSHRHALVDAPEDLGPEERDYLDAIDLWHEQEGGYNHQQSTRPNTLAVGLGDSPAGLAAWIVEKLRMWSDCGGVLESVFTRREVLDWITAYWVSGAIGTSFAPYAHRSTPGAITAPVVFTLLPRDIVTAPRSFASRFLDIRSWTVAASGGHFDAWENPDAYVAGIRTAVAYRSP